MGEGQTGTGRQRPAVQCSSSQFNEHALQGNSGKDIHSAQRGNLHYRKQYKAMENPDLLNLKLNTLPLVLCHKNLRVLLIPRNIGPYIACTYFRNCCYNADNGSRAERSNISAFPDCTPSSASLSHLADQRS